MSYESTYTQERTWACDGPQCGENFTSRVVNPAFRESHPEPENWLTFSNAFSAREEDVQFHSLDCATRWFIVQLREKYPDHKAIGLTAERHVVRSLEDALALR